MPQDPFAQYVVGRKPASPAPDDDPFSAYLAPPRPAPKPSKGWPAKLGDIATSLLPTIGGTVGGIVAGPVGATVGGSAGQGFRSLVQNAGELPGAIADVVGNVRQYPGETFEGFAKGAIGGMNEAALQGGIQGVTSGIGAAIPAVARKLAPALMQSALKPGLKSTLAAVKGGNIPPVVRTLLDEGVNVTPGGIEKLNAIIGATNAEIKTAIGSLPGSINPLRVTSRLTDTARKFSNQVNPQADLEAISDVGQNFLAAHGGRALSPMAAQSLKTGTYAALKDKAYGEVKTAAIEAEKGLARGLKEELAAEAKRSGIDLDVLNAREGAAITARDAIAKRVAMVGNRDPAGLAWLAHSPVTFMMAIAERSPMVKTMIARGMWQAAAKSAGMPVEALKSAAAAIASRAAQDEKE